MYAIKVYNKETGEVFKRIAGENTPIDYRLLETIGTLACQDSVAKNQIGESLKDIITPQNAVGHDWYFLTEAIDIFDWDVYEIIDEEECYAQLLLKFNEDEENFIRDYCGEKKTKFDFLEK